MTIDDCVNYILTASKVVKNFDVVSFSKYNEKNGLRFKKIINDITYIVFLIVSNKRQTFSIQTIFMSKNDYKKKKSYLQTLLNPAIKPATKDTPEANEASISFITRYYHTL